MSQESSERTFVWRMRHERLLRGWSQERLATEVEKRTGLTLNPTVITKLEWALDPERSTKARGLGVNEAVAIARTLEIPFETMTTPETPRAERERQLVEVRGQLQYLRDELDAANRTVDSLMHEIGHLQVTEESLMRQLGQHGDETDDGER